MKQFLPALKALVLFSIVTGVIYPIAVTAVAQLAFHEKANGQFLTDGRGSLLIAQEFKSAKYFSPRPSAIGYNPMPSGGSNLGPTSTALAKQIADRRTALGLTAEQSDDLLTASGSGLDPDISPDSARRQIDRVATARGLNEDQKRKMSEALESLTVQPTFGLLGDPRVNVLQLNLEIDRLGL